MIRASTNETESKDGAHCHLRIVIVRELAQRVHHIQIGLAEAQEPKCKRHSATNDRLSVLEKMVERAHNHAAAHLLTHGNERQTEDSNGLMSALASASVRKKKKQTKERRGQQNRKGRAMRGVKG